MVKSNHRRCFVQRRQVFDAIMMSDEQLAAELNSRKLTKSQSIVLHILRENGMRGATPKQIVDEVSFAPRTVRYALRKLLRRKLIRRIPCLQDMRQYLYFPV